MIPPELQSIVVSLLEKAKSDQVNWVAAADLGLGSEDNDVVVSFPDYSINLYAGEDEGEPFLVFNLLNSKGKRIHGVTLGPEESGYSLLDELFGFATRKISGVDQALAQIQQLLRQDGPVGQKKVKSPKPQRTDDLPF